MHAEKMPAKSSGKLLQISLHAWAVLNWAAAATAALAMLQAFMLEPCSNATNAEREQAFFTGGSATPAADLDKAHC